MPAGVLVSDWDAAKEGDQERSRLKSFSRMVASVTKKITPCKAGAGTGSCIYVEVSCVHRNQKPQHGIVLRCRAWIRARICSTLRQSRGACLNVYRTPV